MYCNLFLVVLNSATLKSFFDEHQILPDQTRMSIYQRCDKNQQTRGLQMVYSNYKRVKRIVCMLVFLTQLHNNNIITN